MVDNPGILTRMLMVSFSVAPKQKFNGSQQLGLFTCSVIVWKRRMKHKILDIELWTVYHTLHVFMCCQTAHG